MVRKRLISPACRQGDRRMVSGILRGGRGDASEFDKALSAFLNKLSSFKPRKYVAEKLTMKESEEKYIAQYFSGLP
jgi:hypothetical protein